MNRPPIGQIANATDARMAQMVDLHQQRLLKSIRDLESRIIQEVHLFETTSAGVLVSPQVNLKQAQAVHAKLTSLFDETYGEGVREVVAGYDEAAVHVRTMLDQDLNASVEFTGFDRDMMTALKKQNLGQFAMYGQQAQENITQALYSHITAGATMEQLTSTIAGQLLGHVAGNGRSMASYAQQFANDAVMNFHNSVILQKGEEAGFDKFLYYGNIMATTREFCRRRAMRVYSKEEIEKWTHRWAGKSGPAMTHRGGYNCRHHWQPVLSEWIPEGELPVNEYPTTEDRFAASPEEKYLKKQLNQLRYNIKTGKTINLNTPLVKDLWYHMHPQERKNLLGKWWNAKVFDDNPAAYDILNKSHMPGKAPPLDKAPPLKNSGVMLTESPNAKFPKPKMAPIADDVLDASVFDDPAYGPVVKPKPKTPKKPIKPSTPAPIATSGSTGGKAWNELTAKEKKVFGNYGYKMKEGKFKYHPTFANVWETLSVEAQTAKVAKWKKLGYVIPDTLPIKSTSGITAETVLAKPKPAPVVTPQPIPKVKVKISANKPVWEYDATGLAEEQFSKTFGFDTNWTGFDAYSGPDIVNRSGDHLWGVLGHHPKLKKIKAAAKKLGEKPSILFVNSGTLDAKGVLGSFNDGTWKMRVAAGPTRKHVHQLNINAKSYSVGGDYYSTLRHEYGHYVDKVLRETTDHQTKWRAIYKSFSKNEWRDIFGTYSSMDKYEGFAEAFSAYTSPLYRPGMMPKKVETYMKKILGDTRKFEDIVEVPKGRVTFTAKKHERVYKKYYERYANDPSFSKTVARKEMQLRCSSVMDALKSWQSSAQGPFAQSLKYRVQKLMGRSNTGLFASKGKSINFGHENYAKFLEHIKDEEIIRARAITQAYLDKVKKKKIITLQRGTDGGTTGPRFRELVNDLKSKTPTEDWGKTLVEFEEPVLTGWTTSERIAKKFSVHGSQKGVRTINDFDSADIFIHDDVWPKTSFIGERETIVFTTTDQTYTLDKIESFFESMESAATKAVKQQKSHMAIEWIEDETFDFGADLWFHQHDDFLSWTQKETIEKMEAKLLKMKEVYNLGDEIVIAKGFNNENKAFKAVVSSGSEEAIIDSFEVLLYNIKKHPKHQWDLFGWVTPDPWEEF